MTMGGVIAFKSGRGVFEQIKHSIEKQGVGSRSHCPPDITPLVLRVRSGHLPFPPSKIRMQGKSHTTHPPNLEGQPSHAWRKRPSLDISRATQRLLADKYSSVESIEVKAKVYFLFQLYCQIAALKLVLSKAAAVKHVTLIPVFKDEGMGNGLIIP